MNQSIKYAANKFYDIRAGNLRTVDGNTVEIDHELIIASLPDDLSNTDMITVDNIGRLYKLPISGLPGGNPFDQDLNTTDDVQFNEMVISNVNPPTTIGYDAMSFIKPELFTPGNWGARMSFYLDNVGLFESTVPHFGVALSGRNDSNISFSQYFTQETPYGWKFSQTSQDSMRIHYQDYFAPDVSRGLNFYCNTIQGNAGDIVPEVIVMSIQSSAHGLGLHISPITSDSSLYIDNITTGINTRFLTLDPSGRVQESIAVSPFDQDLNTTDDVKFNELDVGLQTVPFTTTTTSQLKVTGEPGINAVPYPKTDLGARIELYNNGNEYPLVGLSAFSQDDNAIGMGTYGSTDAPWKKSDFNFWKIQRSNSQLNFICNSTFNAIGDVAIDNLVMTLSNGSLTPSIIMFKPLILMDLAEDNAQTRLLIQNPVDNKIGYRLVSSLPSSNPFNQDLNTTDDVDFNSLEIQNSLIVNNMVEDNAQTRLLIQNPVDNKIGYRLVSSLPVVNPFNQDLNTFNSPNFQNGFFNGIVQTDVILENTVNNGVFVGSYNMQTQKFRSNGLVSVSNPMTFDVGFNADDNSAIQLYAENHDNIGICLDMDHADTIGTTNDFLSGSVLGNVFINKKDGDLDFLFQNGIGKGLLVNKLGMTNVMKLNKTSIDLNQTVSIAQGLICDNLTVDPGSNINFITQNDVSGEIMSRNYEPSYGSLGIIDNLILTTINTVDVYVPLSFIGTTGPQKNITIGSSNFTLTKTGLYEITYSTSIQPDNGGDTRFEIGVFTLGSLITNSIMGFVTNNANRDINCSNTFLFAGTIGDILDLRIRNRSDNEDVILRYAQFMIKRIID